jgi:hypothetical protein
VITSGTGTGEYLRQGGEAQMNKAFRICCVMSLTMAVPSFAVAQSNTAFDGTYAGVSNSATGIYSTCHPFSPMPRPLMVRNGLAEFTGGSFSSGDVVFEGTVSPEGDLRMWDMFANHIIGKIDASGKATGSVSIGDTGCVLTAIWQRQ